MVGISKFAQISVFPSSLYYFFHTSLFSPPLILSVSSIHISQMSIVDLNWFAVTTLFKIPRTRPGEWKRIVYGIHQRNPAKFTPYDTVAVLNLPPGEKYENIKRLSEHLQHMPSICSFWYPELRLDELKYSEDTLFIGLAGGATAENDVSSLLDYLPKISDFGNTLVGERFTQLQLPDIFRKLKVLSHIYMQIGLFDDEVVFRVGSRVSNTQYQEYRWLLNDEICYKPPGPDAENPRIFKLKLARACNCIEPKKHGDITSPEGQTINSITDMITSVIRDTLSQEKGKVEFEFVLQYTKYDQSFRDMFDPENRPPTEYWSDEDYPAIDSGSEPQGSRSSDGPHYYRTNTDLNQDLGGGGECYRSRYFGKDQDNSTHLALTPDRSLRQDSDHSFNEEGRSRDQSQDSHESEERYHYESENRDHYGNKADRYESEDLDHYENKERDCYESEDPDGYESEAGCYESEADRYESEYLDRYGSEERNRYESEERDRYESEERDRISTGGRSGSSSSSNLEWYQPPGYYRPKASAEKSRSCISSREQSQNRNKSVEPDRTPRSSESPCRSRSEERSQSRDRDMSSYHRSDDNGRSSESNEGFSPIAGADSTDQKIGEEENDIETHNRGLHWHE